MTGRNDDMVAHRLDALEEDVSEVKQAIKSIAESLKTLTSLEAHHTETRDGLGRAFKGIADHETRLRKMEENMPILKLTSSWMQRIGWMIVATVVSAVVFLVIKK